MRKPSHSHNGSANMWRRGERWRRSAAASNVGGTGIANAAKQASNFVRLTFNKPDDRDGTFDTVATVFVFCRGASSRRLAAALSTFAPGGQILMLQSVCSTTVGSHEKLNATVLQPFGARGGNRTPTPCGTRF
jgi:hypothetical protein